MTSGLLTGIALSSMFFACDFNTPPGCTQTDGIHEELTFSSHDPGYFKAKANIMHIKSILTYDGTEEGECRHKGYEEKATALTRAAMGFRSCTQDEISNDRQPALQTVKHGESVDLPFHSLIIRRSKLRGRPGNERYVKMIEQNPEAPCLEKCHIYDEEKVVSRGNFIITSYRQAVLIDRNTTCGGILQALPSPMIE